MTELTHADYQAANDRLSAATAHLELAYVASLNLTPYIDGNQWCVLWGADLQSGVSGFGDSPYLAILDFNANMHKSLSKTTHQ